MPLPTLYIEGNLVPQMGEKQKELDEMKPIDYIMDWFDKRIPKIKGGEPQLPITSISDRVIILRSSTGSGKSTSIAPTLFRKFYRRWDKNQILLTQPTQLTTQSITYDIDRIPAFKEEGEDTIPIELFKNLGYQYKENVFKPLERGILICTTGILLQILKNNTNEYICNKFNVIIVDEVHNRSIDVDLILYFLLQLVNDDIKKCPFIILMSATMDPYKYANYYKTKTIFQVNGLTFPIENNYLKVSTPDYISKSVELIDKIHKDNIKEVDIHNNVDMLLFVHNMATLNKVYDKLNQLNETYSKNYLLPIMLTGDIFRKGDPNYNYIFSNLSLIKIKVKNKTVTPVRRVIIGTNVAETGVTIETLKYCLDIGYVNSIEFNPIYNCNVLLVKPANQASVLQRKGRVGRKFDGIWYPLFTEESFNKLQVNSLPNLFTEEITFNLLNIIIKFSEITLNDKNEFIYKEEVINQDKILNFKNLNIQNINLLDNIPYDMSSLSLNKLFILGYIHSNSYPTKLGLLANKFQKINLEHIKIIISGYNYGANIEDLIIIIAYLITGKNSITESKFKSFNIQFDNIKDKCLDNYNYNKLKTRLFISCEFIDFLLFYKHFQIICYTTKDIAKIEEWCMRHKIKYKGMLNIVRVKDDIINNMINKMNLNPYLNYKNLYELLNTRNESKKSDIEYDLTEAIQEIIKIKKCLYEGLQLNIATYDDKKNEYISNITGNIITTNSYLTKNLPILDYGDNFIQTKPKIILYDSIIMKYDNIIGKFIFSPINAISVLDGYISNNSSLISS